MTEHDVTRDEEKDAFVENELKPVGNALAEEVERRLRADGFDVTVTFNDEEE